MSGILPSTERLSMESKEMDTWDDTAVLATLWTGQTRAIESVKGAIPQIAAAASAIVEKIQNGDGRLVYAGAGSSGLLAMQDGMEMTPTFNWPEQRLVFLMAGGDKARLEPVGIAEDNVEDARRDLDRVGLTKHDVVIAVAASGSTPYTVEVLDAARRIGALTVGIANNADTPVLSLAGFPIFLDSGAEVIAGSTRLGAGTAQKAALGMLSSLVMTKMGHVVDGWMVSMIADNAKLKDRAIRMIADIANCEAGVAGDALEQSGGIVKPAVLIARGASATDAQDLLAQSNGQLRAAMRTLSHTTTSDRQ